eukprot:1160614-Pelagomonas_calceolata.AAC.15
MSCISRGATHPYFKPQRDCKATNATLLSIVPCFRGSMPLTTHYISGCSMLRVLNDSDTHLFTLAPELQSGSGGGGLDSKINDAFNAYLESGPKPTVAAIQVWNVKGIYWFVQGAARLWKELLGRGRAHIDFKSVVWWQTRWTLQGCDPA